MIQQEADGSIGYYQEVVYSWEMWIGIAMLLTVVLVIPAIYFISRGWSPKLICRVYKDHIEWDHGNVKVFFKDVSGFYIYTSLFRTHYPGRRLDTGDTKLILNLKNSEKEAYKLRIHQLSKSEQQHLRNLLTRNGLKQTKAPSLIPFSSFDRIQQAVHDLDKE